MADLVGHTLGKYQLVERLGRGGMADVYKGYQPGLDRYVAVKVLHPHLSEEADFITRFQREARSVANLHHPHIVQVFDFDVQDDRYYMVMEYIEGGQTLKELLQNLSSQKQMLPQDQTLDIVAKVADALDYAHSQGMIHRDIKPSNILLRTLNQPVLGDFGIARIIGQTGLTGSGAMIGTPAYMSPEQGRGEQADERSDLYALGIVLYEMLTGVPPYDADTPYGVILKHINDPLVPPAKLIGSLLPEIESITLKSLAKDPIHRYQSAGEMRDALRSGLDVIVNATPTSTATPPPGTQQPKASQDATTMEAPVMDDGATLATPQVAQPSELETKNPFRWWLWGIAGIAALVLIFAVLVVMPRVRENRQDRHATREALSSGQVEEIQPLVELGLEQVQLGEFEAAVSSFSQALDLNPDSAISLAGRGMAYIGLDEQDAAAADITRASELAPDNPFVNLALGMLHVSVEGFYDEQVAMTALTKAIEGCGDNTRFCSTAYAQRAMVQAWDLGNPAEARADIDRAIELVPDQDSAADLYSTRADIRLEVGDIEGAFGDLEAAHEASGEAQLLEQAASIATHIEDYPRALAYCSQLLEEQAGDPHYVVMRGYVQWQAGDMDAGFQSAEQALALHPDLPEAHYLMGLIHMEANRPEEAMGNFELVRQIEPDPENYESPFLTTDFGHEISYDMARAAFAMGDADTALGLCNESLARVDWPLPYILRGRILAERGDVSAAREQYLMALDRTDDTQEELIDYINSLLAELSS